MIKLMVTVSTYTTTELSTQDIGKMINSMVRERKVGLMERIMRVNMKRVKNMVGEN